MGNPVIALLLTLLVGQAPSVSTPPAATAPSQADELVGLWVSETSFGPALRGDLTLTRDGERWRATLAKAQTSFPRDGDTVRFAFPGNLGSFRGALEKGGRRQGVRGTATSPGSRRYHWNLMPTGDGYLGGGAFLRPRDLLKVGQAYLDGGVWRGRRIVDAAWVERSTKPYVQISPATTGIDKETFGEFYGEGEDSWAWHLNKLTSGDRTYREYEASGNGGQLLMVIPELELVVVFTAGNSMQGGIWGRFRDQIVPKEIIPAIRRQPEAREKGDGFIF